MTKEQIIELGVDASLAEKVAQESAKELKDYIPKDRFNEVNEAKKKAEADVAERDAQIEEIKKSAGNNEELKNRIQQLQDEAKEANAKHEAELKETKLANAIKLAISGKTHDEDLVAGLFDKSKLILDDDGKVTGLEEQLKTIKESKGFLFKEEQQQNKPGFTKIGANPPEKNTGGNVSLKEALTAHYNQ